MANQDSAPPPWDKSMSDGGTFIPDTFPIGGNATPDFEDHDEEYHFGGSLWEKTKSDVKLAGKLFKRGWGWTVASPFVFVGVTFGGLFNWNWKGHGKV